MMRISLFYTLALVGTIAAAQVINFDDVNLDSTGYWNGSDLSGIYIEEAFSFNNNYNTEYASWSSFSISNVQDDTTGSWSNQYGVSSGYAYSGSNFAVAYSDAYVSFDLKTLDGFYINNSTFAYQSMLNGDAYAKKFGGYSGDDQDWFMVSVIGMVDTLAIYSLDFYLADFRFAYNTQDYILNEWSWFDLSSLGNVNSIRFKFSSSDVGEYGMNTPAYFCMDDLSVNDLSVNENFTKSFSIYPNPVKNHFIVSTTGTLSIFDVSGKRVRNVFVEVGDEVLVNELNSGIYFVKLGAYTQKIIKL